MSAGSTNVPGRFQVVSEPADEVRVVVDYAHTDDALKNLLETARPLASGRVITVFGCGGDRDKTKRPLMGAVAARLSDVIVVTSDNPRSENPDQIIEDIKRGIVLPADRIGTEADSARRRRRISRSPIASWRSSAPSRTLGRGISCWSPGKGHEKYQVIGERTLPFDDVDVARAALAQRARIEGVVTRCRRCRSLPGMWPPLPGGRVASGNAATPIGHVVDRFADADARRFFRRDSRRDGSTATPFVGEAIAKGAAGVLVATPPGPAGRPTRLWSRPTTPPGRCRTLARFVRRESRSRVVAITGSAGKTTTKEICADLLSARYRVFRNKGNLNNHIGLPLSLLELRSGPDVAVVELGMNHPGEIRTLVGIAEPEVRVWTNVGDAHIGFFESADAIADAKAELLENARPDDVLVANADDAAADVARRERSPDAS